MTILQTILAALNWQVRVNENFSAVSPAGAFGIKNSTTTGLTLGYYGGALDGASYADGTHLLTASTTRYVVAKRSDGVVSSATSTTNWNNTTDYLRMGVAVVGSSTITSWTDWREAFSAGGGGGGGSTDWTDLTSVPAPIEDIAALTDPGADRLLFWDDSASEYTHLQVGTNLSISGTTLNASGGGGGSVSSVNGQTGVVVIALDDLDDVDAAAPADGDVLTYDSGTGEWVPEAPSGGGGGLTGWTGSLNTSSPNGTNNVAAATATTVSTNGDAAFVAKGNGATLAQVPDGSSNGDKRGDRATDWQKSRSSPDQVASGSYSCIPGGQNNKASGNASTAYGVENIASGSTSIAAGNSNTASGVGSVAIGTGVNASVQEAIGIGSSHQANGQRSIVMGNEGSAFGVEGIRVFSSGRLFNQYDTQLREFILKASTSSATPKILTTNNSSAGSNNQITLINGTSSLILTGMFQARDTGNNDLWTATVTLSIKVVSGSGTVVAATITDHHRDSGTSTWILAFTPNTSPRALECFVTGESGKDIRWNLYLKELVIANS